MLFSLSALATRPTRGSTTSGSRSRKRCSGRQRFLPQLEALEGRTVPSYVFSSFDDPNAGPPGPGQGTGAFGINQRGQVVGSYVNDNFEFHNFLLSGGQFTTIDDPNADLFASPDAGAFGINARGQV